MQASPDDVGNIILGLGSLLVVAELISAPLVAPLVMIGKAISNMTSGKKHKSQQGNYGNDTNRKDSPDTDPSDFGV